MKLCDIYKKILKENKQYDKFWEQHGIKPETGNIGFSDKEQKWYGWSHRAINGFGIGDKVEEGDCVAQDSEYPAEGAFPVGFKAKTLEDCKKMAIVFSDSVS